MVGTHRNIFWARWSPCSVDGTSDLNKCECRYLLFIYYQSDDRIVLQRFKRLCILSWVESPSGSSHNPVWSCVCKSERLLATLSFTRLIEGWSEVDGTPRGRGTGPTKHEARDIAAAEALNWLENHPEDYQSWSYTTVWCHVILFCVFQWYESDVWS